MNKSRLQNKKGFTLVEMLMALLITALAGMIALGGITVAANAYRDILMKSQAQMVMKGYMDSIRSTLMTVSPDSGFQIREVTPEGDLNRRRVFFPNGKINCAGYFTLKNEYTPPGGTDSIGGILVFQQIDREDKGTEGDRIYPYDDYTIQTELIAMRTADSFAVKLNDFSYNSVDGAFHGTLHLESKDPLSSGQRLMLEETFTIYPLNYH